MMNKNIFKEIMVLDSDVYEDYRGELWTTYNKDNFPIDLDFNHDKISTSRKNVIRGIHGDNKSWKLVTCLYGDMYFVVVDNRKDSKTYLQWDWIILNDRNKKMVLLPPNFGNSFCVLSNYSIFMYKWSYTGDYADVEEQFSLKWDNPDININWPINNPILSERDK
jgi:dTDP-4-dehydrorhamnose 3,5-epimerase